MNTLLPSLVSVHDDAALELDAADDRRAALECDRAAAEQNAALDAWCEAYVSGKQAVADQIVADAGALNAYYDLRAEASAAELSLKETAHDREPTGRVHNPEGEARYAERMAYLASLPKRKPAAPEAWPNHPANVFNDAVERWAETEAVKQSTHAA